MMNRHLNTFTPYEQPARHEDQLTRAAMIVMRAIPLARDAFLTRVGAQPSSRLPEPEWDMQTRHVLELPSDEGSDGSSLRKLISVFLSPDEGLDLSGKEIEERESEQRLDGVLRFGEDVVVTIETKIVGEASSDQAQKLRLRGVEFEEREIAAIGWHDLLEDWWALLERGLLGPAERVLMDDLIVFAEEHFDHLLPFTTLARAGEHELRRQRRLMAVLREATGIEDIDRRPPMSAQVMLDAAVGSQSTQRIGLVAGDGTLELFSWPAELMPQAMAFYGSDRPQRLLDLLNADAEDWHADPNPHLAYRGAKTASQRLYLSCRLGLTEYVSQWSGGDLERVHAYSYDEVRDGLWLWLRERGYSGAADDDRLDPFLEGMGRRDAHLRPGIAVRRPWSWAEAVALDQRGALADEIRNAVTALLTALEEPLPPACHPRVGNS